MQVSIETTSGLERRLTVGVPAEVVDQEVNKRLSEAAKNARINGFRKGKVPLKVIKQRYGANVRQEVLGDTINRTFYEAVQTQAVRPAGQPSIEPKQLDEGKDLEYVATFEVFPEIELKSLEGFEVTRFDADITEADIDNMIQNLRKAQANWAESDGKVEEGDRVKIDFVGTKDGEAFDGGSASNQELVIGSKQMIPGFEDGIIGMQSGDKKTIDVVFPENYQVDSLKGAKAKFEITLNSVEKQILPEVNEAFFEKFGVFEGGEVKFREDVQANMLREKQKVVKSKIKQQVLEGLLETNPIEIPSALIENEINILRNQMVQQYGAAVQNLDLKTLLPDAMFTEQAKQRTALGLLVSEVVAKEAIRVDKSIVRGLIEDAAATYEDPQEVINYYYNDEKLLRSVEAVALEEQVVALLLEKATVTDVKVTYEEAIKPMQKTDSLADSE